MADSNASARKPVILAPGEGRSYPMGRVSAVFKADGPETRSRYSVSEWWLEPHTRARARIPTKKTTCFTS